ncbi:hypothetical protein [Shewanella chilikensis]|uniref:hypothetical protein n=1 Tax=Shewanella chilikensis TaxID=558541 RepID=UPI00197D446B|nr:hypothetical protein [Shewanella chilikensis]
MVVLLVSLARRAYHFQQSASSSTPFHECRTYYLKSGVMLGSCGSPDQEAERFGTSGRVYRRAVKELIDKGLIIKQGALLKIANLQALQDFVDKA